MIFAICRKKISKIFIMSMGFILCFVSVSMAQREDPYMKKREEMIEHQIIRRGVADKKVLDAMRKVERHLFVPSTSRLLAYQDHPLPIGYGQTISQPYIVAYMTELAQLKESDKVLEIGTGSGYQAAILAEICKEVYTIEIVKPLAESAEKRLKNLGYDNIFVKYGNGFQGWEEHAPFDVIVVTAAPKDVPTKLVEQLGMGGRMVIPIGSIMQQLYVITKTESGVYKQSVLPVRFVPMIRGKLEE